MTAIAKNTRVIRLRHVPKNGTIVLPGGEITTFKIAEKDRLLVVRLTGDPPDIPSWFELNDLRFALSHDGIRATVLVTGPGAVVEITEEVPGAA